MTAGAPNQRPHTFAPDGSLRPLDLYDGPLMMADRGPRQFHVMIKPAGSACNLACTYCFYLSKAALPGGPGPGRMSDETLERLIREYIEGVTAPEVVFTWQGGEPTLMGLAFFRKAMALQVKYAKPGQKIENDLQTNGTLIDDEWCRLLKEHRFLVGLSIDGPREIHDQCRRDKSGGPCFDQVLTAARLLKKYRIPFNTLTCVHRHNARRPLDVYRFLRREIQSDRMQFTPIVAHRDFERTAPQAWRWDAMPTPDDPRARPGHPEAIVSDWSVDPEDWGYFLCKIFDEWRHRDLGKVFVNQFETLVAQHLGLPPQLCVYGEYCGKGVAVEHDGSIYACDHYVYPPYRIGDLKAGKLGHTVLSRGQVKFGFAKSEALPTQCRQCPYLNDCRGECPKNRLLRTPNGEPGLNYLCRGFKQYFGHAFPHVERIAAEIRNRADRPQPRM
jgi:uncharacterized protein